MDATTWVISILSILKVLNLHEKIEELIEAFDDVNINLQERFKRLVTLSKLVHRYKVNRIPSRDAILLSQDFSVAGDDIACVLLEEGDEP